VKDTPLAVNQQSGVAMNSTATSLWERQPQAQISLWKALDFFEAAYRARNLSPHTIAWYRGRLRPFITNLEGRLDREPVLADLDIGGFRLFILEKQSEGKYRDHRFKNPSSEPPSAGHVHGFYRAVRGFSSWLFDEGLMPVNVMATLKLPKLDEKELQPLTEVEELKLLNAYSELKPGECRDKALFMLMLSTGLRRAEVLRLRAAEVNIDEGFITVWGKGKKQRSIPFGHKVGWVLQRYSLLHRSAVAAPNVEEFFLTRDGLPMTVACFEMIFKRARRRTGITRLHPHLLRHTYGTRSSELGIPTLTLQRFMGHSQPKVTERYSHVATSERLKRERSYDHLDGLELRVRRPPR
jgi:integrase/recombinase XerC/integrase/recombinase XerD